MEPVEAEMKLPRQALPVRVEVSGHPTDVAYWYTFLKKQAEHLGDDIEEQGGNVFKIFPRAVND